MNHLLVLVAMAANLSVLALSEPQSSNMTVVNYYAKIHPPSQRQLDLGSTWDIPAPEIFYCDDSASFVFRFEVSDFITNEMFTYDMLRHGADDKCTISILENPYLEPGMVFDETPRGDGSGTRQVAYYLEADSNLIESSPIFYQPDDPDDPNSLPYIKFCMKIMLSDEDGTLINWADIDFFLFLQLSNVGFFPDTRGRALSHEEQDNSDAVPFTHHHNQRSRRLLNCFDGFHVVFDVAPEATPSPAPTGPTASPAPTDPGFVIKPEEPMNFDRSRFSANAEDSYNVNGYLCDDDLQPLEPSSSDTPTFVRTQGGPPVKVCVERNAKCVRDGVFLRQIDAFSFFRDQERQVAIEPVGIEAANGLTELHCERGGHKCWFETYLGAGFFKTRGQVTGSGAVSLQFGSTSDGRQLQVVDESSVDGTLGFRMGFLITTDELEKMREDMDEDNPKCTGNGLSCIPLYLIVYACVIAIVVGLVAVPTIIMRWVKQARSFEHGTSKIDIDETGRTHIDESGRTHIDESGRTQKDEATKEGDSSEDCNSCEEGKQNPCQLDAGSFENGTQQALDLPLKIITESEIDIEESGPTTQKDEEAKEEDLSEGYISCEQGEQNPCRFEHYSMVGEVL